MSRFKAVENTNYAVDLAQANGMRIVGIQGADIVDGTRTLVLGLVWQLMRFVFRFVFFFFLFFSTDLDKKKLNTHLGDVFALID